MLVHVAHASVDVHTLLLSSSVLRLRPDLSLSLKGTSQPRLAGQGAQTALSLLLQGWGYK